MKHRLALAGMLLAAFSSATLAAQGSSKTCLASDAPWQTDPTLAVSPASPMAGDCQNQLKPINSGVLSSSDSMATAIDARQRIALGDLLNTSGDADLHEVLAAMHGQVFAKGAGVALDSQAGNLHPHRPLRAHAALPSKGACPAAATVASSH